MDIAKRIEIARRLYFSELETIRDAAQYLLDAKEVSVGRLVGPSCYTLNAHVWQLSDLAKEIEVLEQSRNLGGTVKRLGLLGNARALAHQVTGGVSEYLSMNGQDIDAVDDEGTAVDEECNEIIQAGDGLEKTIVDLIELEGSSCQEKH